MVLGLEKTISFKKRSALSSSLSSHVLGSTVAVAVFLSAASPLMAADQSPVSSAAQTSNEASSADAAANVDQVVVTGTRGQPRSRLESLAPVDVIGAKALRQEGTTELAAALAINIPSIDFPRSAGADGTDAVRPLTLHGQSPDETLVLLNGQREHASALVNINGTVGRGSAAFDFNTLPIAAIDHIEVLRDGASSLYGSDAIAGVVNIILRQADHGGGASVTTGEYVTSFDGNVGGNRSITDGATTTIDGWQGFKLGSDGYFTITGELRNQSYTNRSDVDPRFPNTTLGIPSLGVDARLGDPDVHQGTLYFNAGKPLGQGWELSAWGGAQSRHTESYEGFRSPGKANSTTAGANLTTNIPSVFPYGFLPQLSSHSDDYTIGAALKGDSLYGWRSNFSVNYGYNKLKYDTLNTLNVSLGPTSPHSFYDGDLIYDQVVGNADFNRDFVTRLTGPLNVAFGVEARNETYSIDAGVPGSYEKGTYLPGTAGIGAQSFPGLQPQNVVDVHRSNIGGYLALEAQPIEKLKVSGAVREENYSDFGSNTSGKVGFRYELTPALALRGSAESGFRAPSLQQEYFTSTTDNIINNVLYNTGTFPATSATAKALGSKPLEPEKSQNYSLGAVWHTGRLEVTLDAYEIAINNRIVLSENLTGAATSATDPLSVDKNTIFNLIEPAGASAARFFINGVNTDTRGLDLVATYRFLPQDWGQLNVTASGNINDFEVTKTPTISANILPFPAVDPLFGRQNTYRLERGTPKYKLGLQGDWSLERWSATARATFYGDVLAPGTASDGSLDFHTGQRTIFDLEARYRLTHYLQFALGAENLLDTYPKQIPLALNATGSGPWSIFSPFGFNGRRIYARLSANW